MQDERTLAAQHVLEIMELKPHAEEILLQMWRDEAVTDIKRLTSPTSIVWSVSPAQHCEMLVEYEQC